MTKTKLRIYPINAVWLGVEIQQPDPSEHDKVVNLLSRTFTAKEDNPFLERQNRFFLKKVRLFRKRPSSIRVGLFYMLCDYAKKKGWDISVDPETKDHVKPFSSNESDSFFDSLNVTGKDGSKIEPYDYQKTALNKAIKLGRTLIISPTASGKSLIIYALVRWYLSKIEQDKKILIVVPNKSLVTQLKKDFQDYSQKNGWDTDSFVHSIFGGIDKDNLDKKIYISTWQSVYKEPKEYFSKFQVVLSDEVHLSSADSIQSMLLKCVNAKVRIGLTGTLKEDNYSNLLLTSSFGKPITITTAKEEISKGRMTPLRIEIIKLNWPSISKMAARGMNYTEQMNLLIGSEKRNLFVAGLACSLEGNTLVLFNFIEKHGLGLHKMIENLSVPLGKNVLYIDGSTCVTDREITRDTIGEGDNNILVATYGTTSTGVNIPRLANIVFAMPYKAKVRTLQSIGRILRLHEAKKEAVVYDIVDDLNFGSRECYPMRHYKQRLEYYQTEGFPFEVSEMALDLVGSVDTELK